MDSANSLIFFSFEICLIPDTCRSSKCEFKTFSFKCLAISNYIVVTLQLYFVENCKFKEENILKNIKQSLSQNQEQIYVVEKYGVSRNTRSTWLLPVNKEKSKGAFQSGEVSTKRKNVRVRQNENLEKTLFDWLKLTNSETILKEKASSYAQELQVVEFPA